MRLSRVSRVNSDSALTESGPESDFLNIGFDCNYIDELYIS